MWWKTISQVMIYRIAKLFYNIVQASLLELVSDYRNKTNEAT